MEGAPVSEWGASSCCEGKGGLGDRGPQRQPQGRRWGWQQVAEGCYGCCHHPPPYSPSPQSPAEVNKEGRRGLIWEDF